MLLKLGGDPVKLLLFQASRFRDGSSSCLFCLSGSIFCVLGRLLFSLAGGLLRGLLLFLLFACCLFLLGLLLLLFELLQLLLAQLGFFGLGLLLFGLRF
jgi:hypothetical protein